MEKEQAILTNFLRRHTWLLLLAVALLLRWWGNGFGLPYIYTSDEAVTVNRAVRFGTGDLNPHWFNYGSLYMYFLFGNYGAFYVVAKVTGLVANAEGFARLFISDPTGFYLIGRAWSGIWSALTVLLVFVLARRWHGWAAGVVAGLILMVNVTAVENAHYILNDPLMVFLMLWCLMECDGIRTTGGKKHYVRAGLALGLAASMKYIPALLLVAVAVAHWQYHRRAALKLWKLPVIAAAVSALAFLAGTPYALLDAPTFLAYMKAWLVRGTQGRTDIPFESVSGWYSVWVEYIPTALGWPGLLAALAGVASLIVFRRAEYLPGGAFFAVYILFICSSKQVIPRYPLPLYPYLAVAAAYLIAGLATYLRRQAMPLAAIAVTVGLTLALTAPNAVLCVEKDVELTLPDTRTLMKEWIEHHLPAETKLLMDPYGPPLAQSRRKLTALYQQALAEGHAKADKFRLQLATLPPLTYEWYWTQHKIYTALPRDQAWSDATLPYERIDLGVGHLREQGIRYVVVSGQNRDVYRRAFMREHFAPFAAFYDEVEAEGKLLARFEARPGVARGPRLELYELAR